MTQLFKILFSTFVLFSATPTWSATPSSGVEVEKKSGSSILMDPSKEVLPSKPTESSHEDLDGLQITQPLSMEKSIQLRVRNPNIEKAIYLGVGYFSGYGTNTDETISTIAFSLGHLQVVKDSFYAYEVEIPEPGLLGASAKKAWFFSLSSTKPYYAAGVRAWFQGADQLASLLKYERYGAFAELGLGDLWTNKQMVAGFLRAGSAMNGFFISTCIQWQFPY